MDTRILETKVLEIYGLLHGQEKLSVKYSGISEIILIGSFEVPGICVNFRYDTEKNEINFIYNEIELDDFYFHFYRFSKRELIEFINKYSYRNQIKINLNEYETRLTCKEYGTIQYYPHILVE